VTTIGLQLRFTAPVMIPLQMATNTGPKPRVYCHPFVGRLPVINELPQVV
jgi:hypothetical protein